MKTKKVRMQRYLAYKDSGVEWLGEIPEDWYCIRMKFLFQDVSEKNRPEAELLSVTQSQGVVPRSWVENRMVMPNGSLESFKFISKGDFAISLRSFEGGLEYCHHDGIISPAYTVLKSKRRINAVYYKFLFKSQSFISELQTSIVGIREGKNISYAELCYSLLPIPQIDEQTRIAEFLDQKTAQIDQAIAQKERQIELLKERRQILIHNAVTRGLNPNVKMKDSGVEWIGKIPEHWEVKELRHLKKDGTAITYGIVQAGPNVPNGIPYIRTGDMSGDSLPLSGYLRTSEKIASAFHRSRVSTGDLVVAIRATLGKALLVPAHLNGANLTQGTAKISPGDLLDNRFLYLAFNSYVQTEIDYCAKGTTFREITLEKLRRLKLATPSLTEQVVIANKIEGMCRKIIAASSLKEQEIKKLKEYKATLINAAVTGKIKV